MKVSWPSVIMLSIHVSTRLEGSVDYTGFSEEKTELCLRMAILGTRKQASEPAPPFSVPCAASRACGDLARADITAPAPWRFVEITPLKLHP